MKKYDSSVKEPLHPLSIDLYQKLTDRPIKNVVLNFFKPKRIGFFINFVWKNIFVFVLILNVWSPWVRLLRIGVISCYGGFPSYGANPSIQGFLSLSKQRLCVPK